MPQDGAKTARPELLDTAHHAVEERSIAHQNAIRTAAHIFCHRRHYFYWFAGRQPLAHARGTMTHRGNADGNMVFAIKSISKRKNETALFAVVLCTRLRIIRNPP